MEKRIFVAILISIAFLWLWAAIAPKLFPELVRKPEPVKPAATSTTSPASTATTSTSAPASIAAVPVTPSAPVAATAQQLTVIDHDVFAATFSNRGAQLVAFQLKGYKKRHGDGPVELVRGRERTRTDYPFMITTRDAALNARLNSALYAVTDRTDRGTRLIEYRYAGADGVSATKTFRFVEDRPHLFEFSASIQPAVPFRINIGPGINNISAQEKDTSVVFTGNGVVQQQGEFEIIPREDGSNVQPYSGVDFIGIEDNYFMTALRPTHGGEGILWRVAQTDAKTKERRVDYYAAVNARTDGVVAGEAFFGPKQTELLDRYNMSEALQLGWFGAIARFFLTALNWINQATHNYGWSIVVLTIIIKIVLYPLQHKSIVSMKKMQKVQPKVEAIKNKYKKSRTDPEQRQKMNVETMQLYQKEGINPMAGCLPILLQLPILWGFYNLLSRAIELRGAEWALWIRDLSEKDPTYVLPILMTATMFIQTYITPMTGDPAQRRIFLFMPLIFGFFFKDFPSGLVLYWLVQNVLTIIQQMIMNKWWKDHPQEIQNA